MPTTIHEPLHQVKHVNRLSRETAATSELFASGPRMAPIFANRHTIITRTAIFFVHYIDMQQLTQYSRINGGLDLLRGMSKPHLINARKHHTVAITSFDN